MNADPIIGLFERLNPVLAAVDSMLATGLGDGSRLVVWGFIAGILSMLLYWLVSPQAKLRVLAEDTKAFRAVMRDGHTDTSGGAVLKSLGGSLQRVGLAFAPALLSSLPILFLIGFLNANYGYQEPFAGTPVAIFADDGAPLHVSTGRQYDAGWVVQWPTPGQSIAIRDETGTELLTLSSMSRAGEARKNDLLSFLFGAPAGTLPDESTVGAVLIEPTPRDILQPMLVFPFQWTIPFFIAVIMASLSVKFIFRIS